jgi:hypothetical protein
MDKHLTYSTMPKEEAKRQHADVTLPWFACPFRDAVALLALCRDHPVRHPQGSAHGFVVLRTLQGRRIATGDMTQVVQGDRVTSRLVFHFRDGSVDDDTTIFLQRGVFRLLSDHHIQRGPSYPKPIEVALFRLWNRATSSGTNLWAR